MVKENWYSRQTNSPLDITKQTNKNKRNSNKNTTKKPLDQNLASYYSLKTPLPGTEHLETSCIIFMRIGRFCLCFRCTSPASKRTQSSPSTVWHQLWFYASSLNVGFFLFLFLFGGEGWLVCLFLSLQWKAFPACFPLQSPLVLEASPAFSFGLLLLLDLLLSRGHGQPAALGSPCRTMLCTETGTLGEVLPWPPFFFWQERGKKKKKKLTFKQWRWGMSSSCVRGQAAAAGNQPPTTGCPATTKCRCRQVTWCRRTLSDSVRNKVNVPTSDFWAPQKAAAKGLISASHNGSWVAALRAHAWPCQRQQARSQPGAELAVPALFFKNNTKQPPNQCYQIN